MADKPKHTRVYVEMKVYDPTRPNGKRVMHVKGCTLIFEKVTPQEVRDFIVAAATRHFRRADRQPSPLKEQQ